VADVPSGFSQISFTTKIVSDEPEEKLRQLAEMVGKHCPVMDSLMRKIAVSGKVEVLKSCETSEPPRVVLSEIASDQGRHVPKAVPCP
jgi:hypothetical protein